MTRRERLERKVERRREWAAKAEARSESRFKTAHSIVEGIPLGQPILVGHHSEKRHRRDIDRMASNMTKGCEEAEKAKNHVAKAGGLEDQLERTIFSDDPDAVEQLTAKIADLEAEAAANTAVNKAFRKLKGPMFPDPAAKLAELVVQGLLTAEKATRIARYWQHYETQPYPAYVNANIRNRVRAARERLKSIAARNAKVAEAEAAPGGLVVKRSPGTEWYGSYATVTFAEKPARSVLEALKAAGFHWSNGSWSGETAKLPAAVLELEKEAADEELCPGNVEYCDGSCQKGRKFGGMP